MSWHKKRPLRLGAWLVLAWVGCIDVEDIVTVYWWIVDVIQC